MIRNTLRIIILVSLCVNLAFPIPTHASGEEPQHYSRKQLKLLMANARSVGDFQTLATYFHHQEMLYRAKAQKVLDDSANYYQRFPMATKTVTRAEVTSRDYDHYVAEANTNAELADRYDSKLRDLGVSPANESATIVSIQTLQTGASAAALTEKKSAPQN